VVTLPANFPKQTSNVSELLRSLDEHRLENQTQKHYELKNKDRLETWAKVLALQDRLLAQFSLPYSNWEVTDNGASLLVELKKEVDSVNLAGDEYLCMTSDHPQPTVVGFYEEVNGDRLRIGLARDVDLSVIAKSGYLTLDNAQVKTILERQKEALRRLKFDETVNPNLRRLLIDPGSLLADKPTQIAFLNRLLDDSQQATVERVLTAHDIFLVQGPPGTGKTTAIVEIVLQILEHDPQARLLITSQSNVAVNHALLSLLEQAPAMQQNIVRVGREEKAGETQEILLHQQLERWAEEVKRRSQACLEEKKSEVSVDSELIEVLRLIQECENSKRQMDALRPEIVARRDEYQSLNKQVADLQKIMTGLVALHHRMQSASVRVSSGDEQLRQLFAEFEERYITWGESFLHNIDAALHLSAQRVELQEELEKLTKQYNTSRANVGAGQSLVQELLLEKFQERISELSEQRHFIVSKVSNQREGALRLGRLQNIAKDWERQLSQSLTSLTDAYLCNASVIGATCIGIAAKRDVSDMEFDWVIVDEAGRATHPELIVPLVRGRKIVLVGDHRQLPPILDRNINEKLLEEIGVERQDLETSLFQELIAAIPDIVSTALSVQYRMHPAIGKLISSCFYDNALRNGVEASQRQHNLSWCPTPIIWYSTHCLPHNQENRMGSSFENVAEVNVVSDLLKKIEDELADNNKRKRVGVITGYSAQKQLLRHDLKYKSTHWSHVDLEVNTVDAYQGREMDIIIYSLVRSNPRGNIGFLRDPRRINVALSRAKELLIIVGDHHTAETASTRGHDNPFFSVLKHIRQHPDDCTLEVLAHER
jgi:hypothetical protein